MKAYEALPLEMRVALAMAALDLVEADVISNAAMWSATASVEQGNALYNAATARYVHMRELIEAAAKTLAKG